MTKIFVSHSSKDTEFAQQIAQLLAELGVNVWIDVADIRAGKNWSAEIQAALDECDLMLVVLSPDSMASANVAEEWQYYLEHRKPIIPLRLRETNIHFRLGGLQYIDFVGQNLTVAFARLCLQLQLQGYEIGSASGQLHTFASNARRVEDILPPPFEWIEIGDGMTALDDGRLAPAKAVPLPGFSIARYPVTNAQYEVFVESRDGYRCEDWWDYSDGARRWRAANPRPRRPGFPGDSHPRTEVSWFEGVAFGRWLSYLVGAQQSVPRISLPTVQQWHCAAVAGMTWAYPWGERFHKQRANTLESGIGRTTPVTHYVDGASPYGVMDMSGNCAEWCLNDWVTGDINMRHEAEQRFVLGGSWNDHHSFASVWHRPGRRPGVRKNTHGFRIAVWL